MIKECNPTIDALKGILILFVIAGHLLPGGLNSSFLRYSIYAFHMPLFLFISGYLFNLKKNAQSAYAHIVKKYWKRMLLEWVAVDGGAKTVESAVIVIVFCACEVFLSVDGGGVGIVFKHDVTEEFHGVDMFDFRCVADDAMGEGIVEHRGRISLFTNEFRVGIAGDE